MDYTHIIQPEDDAETAIGTNPRMESIYENIKYREFQNDYGQDYVGACFGRHGRQYRRGASRGQGTA